MDTGMEAVSKEHRMQWLNNNRDLVPSAGALLAVLLFWIVGLLGGLSFLRGFHTPLAQLVGLYVMLMLVGISIAVAFWAVRELRHRLEIRRHSGG
jgi:uncharacterized membrane protein YphA (DoxX/SURF4 family)